MAHGVHVPQQPTAIAPAAMMIGFSLRAAHWSATSVRGFSPPCRRALIRMGFEKQPGPGRGYRSHPGRVKRQWSISLSTLDTPCEPCAAFLAMRVGAHRFKREQHPGRPTRTRGDPGRPNATQRDQGDPARPRATQRDQGRPRATHVRTPTLAASNSTPSALSTLARALCQSDNWKEWRPGAIPLDGRPLRMQQALADPQEPSTVRRALRYQLARGWSVLCACGSPGRIELQRLIAC